ncbi:MAG: hypothetical protein JEZ07_11855 [Phycisphaerae bacterium]|nr:hypothetical protein [Phycisphaerae bacterium]
MALASRMKKVDQQYSTIELDSSNAEAVIGQIALHLDELTQRLERIRSLGGQYADVEFSPYVKEAMARQLIS